MEKPSVGCSGEAGITPNSTRVTAEDTALGICENEHEPRPVKTSMPILKSEIES